MLIINLLLSIWVLYYLSIYNFDQLKAGILRDKTMADKFMYIPNDDTPNYPFCRLELVAETFRQST